MAHTPYGYRIVNGLAVIDEIEGKKIASLFEEYIIEGWYCKNALNDWKNP